MCDDMRDMCDMCVAGGCSVLQCASFNTFDLTRSQVRDDTRDMCDMMTCAACHVRHAITSVCDDVYDMCDMMICVTCVT